MNNIAETNAARGIIATKVVLSKTQDLLLERGGGVGIVGGSPEEVGQMLAQYPNKGCQIIFDMAYAPNFKRYWNAMVKRANRIATADGVKLSEPKEYFIDGYRQTDKFVMVVE